jgi:hypothetical protein
MSVRGLNVSVNIGGKYLPSFDASVNKAERKVAELGREVRSVGSGVGSVGRSTSPIRIPTSRLPGAVNVAAPSSPAFRPLGELPVVGPSEAIRAPMGPGAPGMQQAEFLKADAPGLSDMARDAMVATSAMRDLGNRGFGTLSTSVDRLSRRMRLAQAEAKSAFEKGILKAAWA